jgi:hypothetical protein
MDGPLEFSLRPQAGSEAVVEFMRDGATGRAVVASATVEPQSVVDAVLDAGRNVLAACRERSWRNRDVEQLATSIEEASRPTTR